MGPNLNGDPHPVLIRRELTSLPARQRVIGRANSMPPRPFDRCSDTVTRNFRSCDRQLVSSTAKIPQKGG